MSLCARCDWQPVREPDSPSPRDQLRQHAIEWAHPLCCTCAQSLDDVHPQTCERCIVRTQETLAGIILLWQELPGHLGHAKAQVYDRDGRGGADEHQLPGGTVLTLLASGSMGAAARRLTPTDLHRLSSEPIRWWVAGQCGPLTPLQWSLAQNAAEGREHAIDNVPEDAPSVAWALASWEDDWRHTRGEPAAVVPGGTAAVVRAAAGYLERHTRWAANRHEAFSEYADDMRQLHARLEHTTGRSTKPVKAEAECFGCGADALIRQVGDEGYEDRWTCDRCGQTYDWSRYVLACKARVEEGRDMLTVAGWGTPVQVAAAVGVPVETVRTWAKRQNVAAVCSVETREMLVWYPDAEERAARRRKVGAA